MPLQPLNSPSPINSLFPYTTAITEARATNLQNSTANYPSLGLPQYISPIRPTVQPVANSPFQYSTPPRTNIFSGFVQGLTDISNAVRTGASAVGDATRTYSSLRTTLQPQIQEIVGVPANRNTDGLVAAQPPSTGNTLTIPYILPQGAGNNVNTYVLIGAAILVVVLLMRK